MPRVLLTLAMNNWAEKRVSRLAVRGVLWLVVDALAARMKLPRCPQHDAVRIVGVQLPLGLVDFSPDVLHVLQGSGSNGRDALDRPKLAADAKRLTGQQEANTRYMHLVTTHGTCVEMAASRGAVAAFAVQ